MVKDLDLVTDLRRAIHARSVRGSRNHIHDHHNPQFPLSYAGVPNIEDRQTLLCGGTAIWLYHVYRALGFQTFAMNTGASGASHVMTFVRISHEGRPLWSMQDAYLNMTFVGGDGGPLCLTNVYEFLTRKQYEKIDVSVSPGLAPVSLREIELDERRFHVVKHIAAHQGVELRLPSDDVVYLEWNYASFPCDPLRDRLRMQFGSDHFALLLALPIGTSGEPYAEDFKTMGAEVFERIRVTG